MTKTLKTKFIVKAKESLPPGDGDFTDGVVSVSGAGGSLGRVVLALEMKPYLRGFYKLLKRWGIIEIIVSRPVTWSGR